MATVNEQVQPAVAAPAEPVVPELKIYSHSSIFYWWPVWVLGYVMAILTRLDGSQVRMGDVEEWFHPSRNLGVIFTVALFLVVVITNVSVRGLASVVVVLTIMFLTVLFAYLGWWDDIMRLLPHLSVHMNLGFYLLISTLLFVFWASSVFIYDRMSYWRIRPGQITHERIIGSAEKSYDTHGMVLDKQPQDLFRHWLLGFGAGDLQIHTGGAKPETLRLPNVLFVDMKINQVQKLIAMKPDESAIANS